MFPSATPSSQTSSGITGFPFMVGPGHKNGVAFAPNTSSSTPITCGNPYHSGFGSPVADPFVFMPGNKKGDSFASNHLATSTFTSSGTSSRPSYRPTPFDGPVSTSSGYRATSNVEKLVSISATPAYKTISHEELRLEDYMTGKRGLGTNSSAVKSTSFGSPHCSSWPANMSFKIPSPKATPQSVKIPCYGDGEPWSYNPFSKSFGPRTSPPASTVSPDSFKPWSYNPFSKSFGPRTSPPASTVSPDSFKPWSYNPFAKPSTSPATQSSFSSFSNPTFPLFTRDSKSAPLSSEPSPIINNPFAKPSTSPATQSSFSSFSNPTFPLFIRDPKNTHVSSEQSPVINKPTTLVSPCVPSTQKCDEEVTRVIGQSSASQLSSSHTTSTSSLANPFGTLPPRPQLSFEHSRSTPIQYGISSIPVKDKPAPVKYPLPTTRHISRGCKLPVRKYDPKSSVPFFLSEL